MSYQDFKGSRWSCFGGVDKCNVKEKDWTVVRWS